MLFTSCNVGRGGGSILKTSWFQTKKKKKPKIHIYMPTLSSNLKFRNHVVAIQSVGKICA